MKLGVFTVLLSQLSLQEALGQFKGLGIQAVELGCGYYPGTAHCNTKELLADEQRLKDYKAMIDDYGLEISALSAHGNPVHPNEAIAKECDEYFKNAVRAASKLGVDTVVGFSGCPAGAKGDTMPNWVTCSWPTDFTDILDYQWNEVLIPYWEKATKFANDHGIKKVALELHPGFCVYNPDTLMKLRNAVGDTIGANFDPSHLFWQGIDIPSAIRYLGESIYHFHAKDTKIDPLNTGRTGVLDTKHYGKESERSWVFRSVGYGHDYQVWKDIMSNLRMVGYDGAISIEHEDSLMSINEGLEKAVVFLKEVIINDPVGEMFWA